MVVELWKTTLMGPWGAVSYNEREREREIKEQKYLNKIESKNR
jgi:hypothetical protein